MLNKIGWEAVLKNDAATALIRRAAEGDSALASRMTDSKAVLLVLDGAGERIVHASEAATGLRRAISDSHGRLLPTLRFGAQIQRARPRLGNSLLLRLHIDPRRIAPPALVTILRARTEDGIEALILLAATPLPRLRTLPTSGPIEVSDRPGPLADSPDAVALVPAAPDLPEDPDALFRRFTWKSDADGRVSDLSRAPGDPLRERMLGRTWRALSDTETLRDAEGLLAALAEARTFRAIPVTLIAADASVFELELSGSPVDRSGRGFRGFGQVRSVAPAEAHPPVAEPEAIGEGPEAAPTVMQDQSVEAEQTEEPLASPPTIEANEETSASTADPSLSSNEHAAFREIARALGARFAGDDAGAAPLERGLPCAVMPFPASASRSVDAVSPDAAMVATLERLPAGVLVYRDNTVLFANRRLLDLTGYADTAMLDAAGGIERLFGGLMPHTRVESDTPVVLTARDGGRLGALIEHSVLDWAGQPAELLLARDSESSDAFRASAANALAQDFAGRRGAEAIAVLDRLDDGIATLDGQARILALNRSAAATFGLDAREIVGASFLGLFAPENAVDLLARLHAEPGSEPVDAAVMARATGIALRVKVLPMDGDGPVRLCAVIGRAITRSRHEAEDANADGNESVVRRQPLEFLAQVTQEIRTPIDAILALADRMLGEPHGPLGSERYRGSLREIHASGTQVLDRVDGLLELAQIEAGHLDLSVAPIPLNEVVARCVAQLQPQAARERIVVRTSFSADLEILMADERSVRQATLNVIANAIAFSPAGGQVIVSTSMADRGEIALRVRDTGIGMTAEEVEGALRPFRQIEKDGLRKGTGLGLPLTKALVEANHGRFRIDSRRDEGTLVEMLFPGAAATKRA
ncbi:ATP-binding protein [Methylobacterium sp. J-078]|uniref:PAS domain-containing sensor histidine kinase n=1 Tax=Methylobacterium sp. J-078 TaxID=2836657 RepID=UPI001FBA1044|nr:PAS domain-containing sensor histidine kinase [Methylobacterium sp. J-078]MCJ2045021.1 ATP-binding protein [Methylobacterium sp. J-078]